MCYGQTLVHDLKFWLKNVIIKMLTSHKVGTIKKVCHCPLSHSLSLTVINDVSLIVLYQNLPIFSSLFSYYLLFLILYCSRLFIIIFSPPGMSIKFNLPVD